LGIRLGDSPFVSNRNLFVEGLSEYHILFGFSHHLKHKKGEDDILDISEVSIIAVDGARKMSTFGKWAESEGFAYALLLDNDQEGQDVKETISEKHTEIEPDRIVMLNKEDATDVTCIEIEDMFSPKTYIECLNDVYNTEFDDFEEINVHDVGDKWEIGEYEYDGEGIVRIIEDILEEQDVEIDKLMKKDVAIELKRRLMSNPDIPEKTEADFKKLLGTLRATTGS
jgi:predicted ATP-dependent endonuclease of OLD family